MSFTDDTGVLTEDFRTQLPTLLGDDFYNDPATKQEPTKMFDNIKDIGSLAKMAATAQRKATQNEAKYAEKYKGMVRIPDEKASPEDVAAYRKAVGVPDKPEGYELAIPEEDKEGFTAIANEVRKAALEVGLPAKALSGVWTKVVAGLAAQTKAIEDKGLALMAAEEQALKDKYQGKYGEFVKAGDDALSKFKAGADVVKILDTFGLRNQPAIREFLAEIAPLVLEKGTIGGTGATGGEKPAGVFDPATSPSYKPA